MKRLLMAGFLLLQGGWVAGAGKDHLTLAGSSTIQPVMEVVAEAYEKNHPGVTVDVQGGGSSVGIAAPREGLADIGMVSRALHDDEKTDLVPIAFALDGLAIVAHAANPLWNITKRQVIDVYSGKITDWGQIGGGDAPITVINKEDGRATLELFEEHFGLKGRILKNAVIVGPNGQAIATVAGNPHAVAYVSIGSAKGAEEEGVTIRRLSLDGVAATMENVKNGTYGLRRPLTLVTKGAPTGLAKRFLDYVMSDEGQRIVAEQGFVPVKSPAKARAR